MKPKTICCKPNENANSLLSDNWNRKQFVDRQIKLKTVCCKPNETENNLL